MVKVEGRRCTYVSHREHGAVKEEDHAADEEEAACAQVRQPTMYSDACRCSPLLSHIPARDAQLGSLMRMPVRTVGTFDGRVVAYLPPEQKATPISVMCIRYLDRIVVLGGDAYFVNRSTTWWASWLMSRDPSGLDANAVL